MMAAAKSLQISDTTIRSCLHKKAAHAGGFYWMFADDPDTPPVIDRDKIHIQGKSVDQLDLKGNYIRTFSSLREAAQETGSNTGNITRACKKGTAVGGYRWKYNEH